MKSQKKLIHNTDWDKLIILDACRPDKFRKYYSNYFEGEYQVVESAGTDTLKWVAGTFPDKYNITYVSGAVPITKKGAFEEGMKKVFGFTYAGGAHFKNITEVWDFGWSDTLGTVSPKAVTEEGLKHRKEKAIIHYFQPHAPFIGEKELLGLTGSEEGKGRGDKPVDEPIWNAVRANEISIEELEEAYEGNLKLALNEARKLIKELSGKIIITSDHSNHLGEGGKLAHSGDDYFLKKVPWLEVEKVIK